MTRYSINDTWQDTSAYIEDAMRGFTGGHYAHLDGETGESIIENSRTIDIHWDVTAEEIQRWLDERTPDQIAWEVRLDEHGMMDEEQATAISRAVYLEVDGSDDHPHADDVQSEIRDWLREGDFYNNETLTLASLADEWREYSAEEML